MKLNASYLPRPEKTIHTVLLAGMRVGYIVLVLLLNTAVGLIIVEQLFPILITWLIAIGLGSPSRPS
ncbi:MAG: hypothetical protein JSU87_15915 [Gemmatimonadota bacterium]|nr:MAG: hypothetical protein JSU87_15915 [Gemmatimonadota bacterium]